jgi:type II secretory pathway predicted ATPase ExeA
MPETALQQRLFPRPAGLEDTYRNTALDMLLTSVLQQIHNTAQIQVIKGEQGLGKTSFCKRLVYEAPADSNITLIQADRKTGVTEILHVMSGAREDDTRAPLQVLAKNAAQALYQQLYNQLQPVVLIDDAHCLSTQTLANLFRFQYALAQQNSGGFKLILVGERKIDSRLEGVDKKVIDRDRFISSLLRPLNRNEIADYIEFKLLHAQGDKPKLNKKQLQYVRSHSGGIPGKIETLCVRALQGSTFGMGSALAAICALALIAGGLAYHQGLYDFERLRELTRLFDQDRKPARVKSVPKAPPVNVVDNTTAPETPATGAEPDSTPAAATDSAMPVASTEADSNPATASVAETEAANSMAWLSNQPAEHYLIQLAGNQDRAKMESYRQSLKLPYPLTMYKTERNGQDWYLLFYGPFPDYESAVDAREQLPVDLRKNQPWIRQIGSILEKQ